MKKSIRPIAVLVLAVEALAQAPQATFQLVPAGVPLLPWGMSGDGSTIVGSGNLNSQNIEAWRWMRSGLVQSLGGGTVARAASLDGMVIVGGGLNFAAFIWRGGQVQNIPPGPSFESLVTGYGASESGDVVVGTGSARASSRAFRWTLASGTEDLGVLPGFVSSKALAVSRDGTVIAGNSTGPSLPYPPPVRAFGWIRGEPLFDLGSISPDLPSSTASSVSGDGRVIVGWCYRPLSTNIRMGFRWTAEGGMRAIGTLGATTTSFATGVSDDGSVVVGMSGPRAFMWTKGHGMVDLEQLLITHGANLQGAHLHTTVFVSSNGRRFGGHASNASSAYARAWVAEIPLGLGCYVNCDLSIGASVLTAADFHCFLDRFAAGASYANCDASTETPVLTANDFVCFINSFAAGCP